MVRVGRRHPARPWPLGRAASFLGGLGVIAVALMSAVGRYDTTFFWIHMIQHLLLIMVAPALLIHGRPLTLAMHATRNPWHTRIKRLLRSRPVTVLTCPLVAIPLYAGVVVGTHLTSFNNLVVTIRPWPRRTGRLPGRRLPLPGVRLRRGADPVAPVRPAKMLMLVLTMPIDTFTGLTLLMTTRTPGRPTPPSTTPWARPRHRRALGWGDDVGRRRHHHDRPGADRADAVGQAAPAAPGCAGSRTPAAPRWTATRRPA